MTNAKKWITQWASAQANFNWFACDYTDRTVSVRIRASLNGEKIRIGLSNLYGTQDVTIAYSAVAVIRQNGENQCFPLLFDDDSHHVCVPAGQQIKSLPVSVDIEAGDTIETRLYYETKQKIISGNASGVVSHSSHGNYTLDVPFPADSTNIWQRKIRPMVLPEPVFLLSSVEIFSDVGHAVVVLGDSNAIYHKWTEPLKDRIEREQRRIALVNAGIVGNCLLKDVRNPVIKGLLGEAGIKRMEWDVFGLSEVKCLLIALGTNDIFQPGTVADLFDGKPASSKDMQTGYIQIANAAKSKGIKVVATTIPPAGNAEKVNRARKDIWNDINEWIRNCGIFDAVIDFAAISANPEHPDCLAVEFDDGDGMHFSSAGGLSLANSIDLDLLQ